jgi:hypothetical protein
VTWRQLLAGVPVGVLLGIAVKAIFDAFSERRRRNHDQRMRLLDDGLKHGIGFLSAADRLRLSAQRVDNAWRFVDGAKGQDAVVGEKARERLDSDQRRAAEDLVVAQDEYNALRLLIPSAENAAREYLHLCGEATAHDVGQLKREEARKRVEDAIRGVLGGLR